MVWIIWPQSSRTRLNTHHNVSTVMKIIDTSSKLKTPRSVRVAGLESTLRRSTGPTCRVCLFVASSLSLAPPLWKHKRSDHNGDARSRNYLCSFPCRVNTLLQTVASHIRSNDHRRTDTLRTPKPRVILTERKAEQPETDDPLHTCRHGSFLNARCTNNNPLP